MPNMDFFGFFDYTVGDPDTYEYMAKEFAEMMRLVVPNGVVMHVGNGFGLTRSGLSCTLGAGAVWLEGHHGGNRGSTPITLPAAASGNNRIDYIIAELYIPQRRIALTTLSGTPTTGTPTAPTLQTTESLYQFPLYRFRVSGASVSTVEDVRVFNQSGSRIRVGSAAPAYAGLSPGEIYIQLEG